MLTNINNFLKICLKKTRFALNKNLVFKKINGVLMHRTKLPLLRICKGKGLDIGCGSDKIIKSAVGVDIIGRGETGKYGCEKGKISKADIKASGDNLYMLKSGSMDYIVARDNIEHYVNFIKALKEWHRVLKKGGKLGITTPNDNEVDSLRLDPTHKHAFTPESLKDALETLGFKVVESGETIRGWGFYIIAEKMEK